MVDNTAAQTAANLDSWNANAAFWDQSLGDRGNDLFEQLILPCTAQLAGKLTEGTRILDLGCGNGMIARELARDGVTVVATDYSESHLKLAAVRAQKSGKQIHFETLDLMNPKDLDKFAEEHTGDNRFDVVTGSMLLKELADITPLAQLLPKIMKESGRAIFANPHPCFQKPAAHRVMEVYEDPEDGQQKQLQWIKVSQYLKISKTNSQALRGQPSPLVWFHRPIHELLNPFADAGLTLHKLMEPSFNDAPRPDQVQNYHNYPQIPMLFIFSFRFVV